MVTEGIEPSTVALLAQRSNQLSYATFLLFFLHFVNNIHCLDVGDLLKLLYITILVRCILFWR